MLGRKANMKVIPLVFEGIASIDRHNELDGIAVSTTTRKPLRPHGNCHEMGLLLPFLREMAGIHRTMAPPSR